MRTRSTRIGPPPPPSRAPLHGALGDPLCEAAAEYLKKASTARSHARARPAGPRAAPCKRAAGPVHVPAHTATHGRTRHTDTLGVFIFFSGSRGKEIRKQCSVWGEIVRGSRGGSLTRREGRITTVPEDIHDSRQSNCQVSPKVSALPPPPAHCLCLPLLFCCPPNARCSLSADLHYCPLPPTRARCPIARPSCATDRACRFPRL